MKISFNAFILFAFVSILISSPALAAKCEITIDAKSDPAPYEVNTHSPDEGKPWKYEATVTASNECLDPITVTRGIDKWTLSSGEKKTITIKNRGVRYEDMTSAYEEGGDTFRASDACGWSATGYAHQCFYKSHPETQKQCEEYFERRNNEPGHDGSATSLPAGDGVAPVIGHIISARLVYDSEYVKRIQTERKFNPKLPFSLFDEFNLIINMKKCYVPQNPPFKASLMTLDSQGNEITLQNAMSGLQFGESFIGPSFVWEHADQYWSSSITEEEKEALVLQSEGTYLAKFGNLVNTLPPEQLEVLIDSIFKNRPIFIRITDDSNPRHKKEVKVPMTNCAQFYESGKHKMVFMRGTSSKLAASGLINNGDRGIKEGFAKIEPFKTYLSEFSFFIDFVNHDDSTESVVGDTFFEDLSRKISSCGPYMSQTIFYRGDEKFPGDFFGFGSYTDKNIFMRAKIPKKYTLQGKESLVLIHETGHAFANLDDEYDKSKWTGVIARFYKLVPGSWYTNINCVNSFNKYLFEGKLFGESKIQGCGFEKSYYPSSDKNIMKDPDTSQKFSLIQCANILSNMKGGVASSYLKDCLSIYNLERPNCNITGCPKGFQCEQVGTFDKLCIES